MRDDLTRAKSIDIEYFLSKNGIKPKRESSSRAYYLSPFRDESSPSFIVYKDENRFYDWGEKWGGDVIDIASRIWACNTSEAIKKLLGEDEIPLYHKRPSIIERMPGIEILGQRDTITNEALIEYMEKIRCVPIDVINRYCKEVTFQFPNSRYATHYGVGIENDVGGFTLRSTWFKGSTAPAGVKTVKTANTDECFLFEGFLDFMSYVVMWGEPEHTVIILNSTVFVHMMLDFLQGMDKVHAYVDNDNAGNIAIDELISNSVNVVDHRHVFADYTDLNEKLQAEKQ